MGVSLAVRKLDKALAKAASDPVSESRKSCENQGAAQWCCLYTLGPIIHNPQLVAEYEKKGAQCLENEEMGRALNGGTVVIRAHGIPSELERSLVNHGLEIIDATCPKVKAAQLAIKKAHDDGYSLLLFGESEHPEVLGLLSYASPDAQVFASMDELSTLNMEKGKKYVIASQTTQDNVIFKKIVEQLNNRLAYPPRILKTICAATKNRQKEVLHLSKKCRSMVIIGGKNSGNTRRLAELSSAQGLFTVHCEVAAELPLDDLKQHQPVGLSAGASTPFFLIDEAEQVLKAY